MGDLTSVLLNIIFWEGSILELKSNSILSQNKTEKGSGHNINHWKRERERERERVLVLRKCESQSLCVSKRERERERERMKVFFLGFKKD